MRTKLASFIKSHKIECFLTVAVIGATILDNLPEYSTHAAAVWFFVNLIWVWE